jgi:hypothetical protein
MMQAVTIKAKKDTTARFYGAIKADYRKLKEVRKKGAQLYSDKYILAELAEKYFRQPSTIENILFNRV